MKRIIASFVCLIGTLCSLQAQTKWFVTPGAPAAGTGNSWADPRDLQTAINNAASGDSVFVAQGLYQLASGQTFSMKGNVKIYGRFAGTETFLSERNLKVTYASTLRANNGRVITNNNNGLLANAVLDGFTITNGTANTGGGIYNAASSPTISNCIFTANNGAGIYNTNNSAATIINCVFTGNTSTTFNARGAGISNYNADGVTIMNCVFTGNTGYSSGAISVQNNINFDATIKIFNCTMYGNRSTVTMWGAGGLEFDAANLSQVNNCIIWGNSSASNNPGIIKQASPDIQYITLVHTNNIQQGYPANWDFDPHFVNPTNPIGPDNIWGTADDGLRLQAGSLASNTGTPDITSLPIPNTDFAGDTRVQGSRIDLGAYESLFACNGPGTLYVDSSVAISGDGSSWSNAFKSFYEALVAANQCTNVSSILVAQGTYQPPTKSSYNLVPHVKIYGGFPVGGASFAQRNPKTYATILKANGNRVIFNYAGGLDTTTLLDGFTITGGTGSITEFNGYGTGILNVHTSPTINNCIISGNTTLSNGGAGGGMYNRGPGADPVISHCTFINNTAATTGNGGGAAIFNADCAPIISHCNFINNTTTYGGAIYNGGSAIPVITNSIFAGNNASKDGGAIANYGNSLKITNSTFVNNTAGMGGGAIDNWNSALTINNAAFWGNTGNTYNDIWQESGPFFINYSFTQGTWAGTGNIVGSNSPFVNAASLAGADGVWYTQDDGLMLASGSPCINAGIPDTTGLFIGNTDIAGKARIVGSAIDIGAYEYDNFALPVTLLGFTGNLHNNMAYLQWRTTEELNFKHFAVEKSTDGFVFLPLGIVPAKGSGSNYNYATEQQQPVTYYRLKLVDIDGSATHSRYIRLSQQTDNSLLVYPNPATNHINMQVAAAGSIFLYTADGRMVKAISLQAGLNTIDISELGTGVYYGTINGQQLKFVKK
ncbi:MAG TPA: choice-of-anchor Q domain-containing protein [Niastella sp.]